jgi:polyribonucleotide nucleotidyltransferase
MERELQVRAQYLGALIGPGGQTLKRLEAESGAMIRVADSGRVTLSASTRRAIARAEQLVRAILGPDALAE